MSTKKYGFSLSLAVFLTFDTGGLWFIWILIRYSVITVKEQEKENEN